MRFRQQAGLRAPRLLRSTTVRRRTVSRHRWPFASLRVVRARSVAISGSATAAVAVLGNLFVGKEGLAWFRSLRAPRGQLPMPGFLSVAAAYYVIMGYVLARAVDRRDSTAIGLA